MVEINSSSDFWPSIDVKVDVSDVVGINSLSLGFQIDLEWKAWTTSPLRKELAKNASFELVRFFDFRPTVPRLAPCTYWDETSKTGTWNWINVDNLVQTIFDVGAEPLICLGWVHSNSTKTLDYIPTGMALDPTNQLPYAAIYSKYCVEWVKHFKATGLPVRYCEIFNEPWTYFGWAGWENLTRLGNFKILWDACAKAMRMENSAVKLSFDFITAKRVLDYWLKNGGENVDYLDFHKYDGWSMSGYGYFNDTELFMMAERERFESYGDFYGVDDARQAWFNVTGKILPVICSESNLNSVWKNGTDPRIRNMTGAVWTALVLREAVLKGLNYYTYFNFGGDGFGMVDFESDTPWYTYYVQQTIGSHLAVGDQIKIICTPYDGQDYGPPQEAIITISNTPP